MDGRRPGIEVVASEKQYPVLGINQTHAYLQYHTDLLDPERHLAALYINQPHETYRPKAMQYKNHT